MTEHCDLSLVWGKAHDKSLQETETAKLLFKILVMTILSKV